MGTKGQLHAREHLPAPRMHHVMVLHQEERVLCAILEGTEAVGTQKRHRPHCWVQEDFLEETVVLTVQWGGKER